MLFYYIRVSTELQNEMRQIKAAECLNIPRENIYIDKQSGKNADRKQLQALLQYVRKGDTVYCESISRIARNTRDFLKIVDELTKKGVNFVSQKESIDTSTPQGKFMLTVFAALSELEREQILERQKEGIAVAKSLKKYKGKPKTKIDETKFKELCGEWRKGNLTATAVMKELDLKPNTFYRRVKEWGL